MTLVPLGEIADIQLGKMLSPKAKTGEASFPYLRNQNVQWGKIKFDDLAFMDFSDREREKFSLRSGDLLVCEGGEPGRCAIWNGERTDCYYQKALHRVRPHTGKADPEFLSLWIRYQAYTGSFEDQNAKTTIAHLPLVRLQQLLVPDVSVQEQRRIAAHLKAQLTVVEDARQAAQLQLKDAASLARRIREEAMAELNEVGRVPLVDLLTGIEAGKSFQTSERLARDDELGVLKVSAVSWAEFKAHEAKAIDGIYAPDKRHYVKAGDLLISRANTVELVGAVVRVERDYPCRLLSDKTLRLLVNEGRVCPDYLVQILRMPEARAHIEGNATGTSDSMRNISQGTIHATPIPLPPLKTQRRMASRLRDAESALNQLRQSVDAAIRDIDRLPSRLLAQAFTIPGI